MRLRVETVHSGDRRFVHAVAEKVFSAYDGAGPECKLENIRGVWGIHLAKRAGVFGVECDARKVCVKLFYDKSPKARLRNFLRCSKAKRAWRCGLRLMQLNVPVPDMVGYAENKAGMALVITELVENALRLDEWIEQRGADESTAAALGRFVRKMHDAGITHKDLSLRNILVRDETTFLLLDYEDARFFQVLSQEKRMDNLHHLHERVLSTVSENIGRSFLTAYLEDLGLVDLWCSKLNNLLLERPSKYTKGLQKAGC